MANRKSNKKTVTDLDTLVNEALASIKHIADVVPLDVVSPQDALVGGRVATRAPDEAVSLAINVVNADPSRFPTFDAARIKQGVEYVQTVAPLATAVNALAQVIRRNVQKRRGYNATQALGVYQTLKVQGKQAPTEAILSHERDMRKLFTTHVKRRALTVTVAEQKAMKKGAKATKLAVSKAAIAAAALADAAEAANVAVATAPPATPIPNLNPVTPAPAAVVTPAVATPQAGAAH